MPEPKVSIVVPVYNAEKYLGRCLDSLRNQTLEDIEIILVDDASRDGSPAICDEAAENDRRIKVIHKCNEGAGMARNAGLKIATGEYVGFVDSDDYVDAGMYEALYGAATRYESELVMAGVKFVGGNIFSQSGDSVCKNYFENDTLFTTAEDMKNLRLGIVGALPGETDDSRYGMGVWKNLFRRDVIEANYLRFMSERNVMSEDALFMMDYASCARSAVGINGAFYNYCRNDDSVSKGYKKDRFHKGMIFLSEVEKRLDDVKHDERALYLDRFVQAFCRMVCSQEIMYASEAGVRYSELKKRLKAICTHEKAVAVLSSYPIWKLPLKQAVFAFAMKHRMYLFQKIIVGLRDG